MKIYYIHIEHLTRPETVKTEDIEKVKSIVQEMKEKEISAQAFYIEGGKYYDAFSEEEIEDPYEE